jgi:hypothetical protein
VGTIVLLEKAVLNANGKMPFGAQAWEVFSRDVTSRLVLMPTRGAVTPAGEHRLSFLVQKRIECRLVTPRPWSCMSSPQRRASAVLPADEAACESASDPNP